VIVNVVELGPFAGISVRKEIRLTSGLNIVLGANEAGKSTIVEALLSALFLPIRPRKNSPEDKRMKDLLPISGGDTIKVGLSFRNDDGTYSLNVVWGKVPSIELRLPDGNILSGEEGVRKKLTELLAYGSATYKNILVSRQKDMAGTIESLRANAESTNMLGEALRRTMFEADGVSVDSLGERIASELDELRSHWNIDQDRPERDRRRQKGIGKIVKSHYEIEDLKDRLRVSREGEENYAQISDELKGIQDEKHALSAVVNQLKHISGDIQKRKECEPRLELIRTLEDSLKKANKEWPRAEKDLENLERSVKELVEQKQKVKAELEAANEAAKYHHIIGLYNRSAPVYAKIQALELQFKELPKIERQDLQGLKTLENEIEKYKTSLSAGKLSATLASQKSMELFCQRDFEETRSINLDPGEERVFDSGGRLVLESEQQGWRMELWSGGRDIKEIKERYDAALKSLHGKKEELNVESVEEAEKTVERREEITNLLNLERRTLKTMLGDKVFESLKTEYGNLGEIKKTRELEQIMAELRELDSRQNRYEIEALNLSEKLREWANEYGEHDRVFERLGELNYERKEIESELSVLAPLPDAYRNTDSFQKDLEEKEKGLQELKDKENQLRVNLAAAEANLPEESTEDLEKALQASEKELNKLKVRAKSLVRVQNAFNRVIEDMDKNPYGPLVDSFTTYLAPLTGNQYKSGSMKGPLPSGIMKQDGTEIPMDLLSTGTVDGTAIALRLAMAEHLLQGRKGFIIMDDPLVNLDPERRKAAAGVLRQFATKFQLIITTCDPDTAGLLGGNLIKI
jgi:exonuclease SbcC